MASTALGRRGPLPKAKDPSGRAIPGSRAIQAVAPATAAADVPRAPDGLHRLAREAWGEFWRSTAAQWVDRQAHMPRLIRWARDLSLYYHALEDLQPSATKPAALKVLDPRRPWLGKGSRAQVTVHATADFVDRLEQRLHRAEIEFGMTPYSAVRLAGAGVQGALTAEQLNRMLAEREAGQPSEDDPAWAAGLKAAGSS